MQRKFIGNIVFLIVVNLLVKPFWILGIDRTVQNTVSTSDYGIFFAVFNFSFLFHVLLDIGITHFNTRAISRNPNRLDFLFGRLFPLKLIFSLGYFAVTFIAAYSIGFSSFQKSLLVFLGLNQVFLSALLYLRSHLSALQLFKIDGLISVLDRVLAIAFCSILLWHSQFSEAFTIERYLYAQTAALGISVAIAFFVVLSRTRQFRIHFDLTFFRRILKKTYPFALLGIIMSLYNRTDGVMIERLLPDTGEVEAGIYAASYRLLEASNMIGFLFATILLPLFARMVKKNESVKDLIWVSYGLVTTYSITLSMIVFQFGDQIMPVLYVNSTDYWNSIFLWVMLALNGTMVVYTFGTLMVAAGQLKKYNLMAVACLIVNVGLNFATIPKYGAQGAAVATLVTQCLMAILLISTSLRFFKMQIRWSIFLKLVGFVLLLFGFGYLAKTMDWSWIWTMATMILIGAIYPFVTQMVDLSLIRKIGQEKFGGSRQ